MAIGSDHTRSTSSVFFSTVPVLTLGALWAAVGRRSRVYFLAVPGHLEQMMRDIQGELSLEKWPREEPKLEEA